MAPNLMKAANRIIGKRKKSATAAGVMTASKAAAAAYLKLRNGRIGGVKVSGGVAWRRKTAASGEKSAGGVGERHLERSENNGAPSEEIIKILSAIMPAKAYPAKKVMAGGKMASAA
jgi:hypothetical protein